VADRQPKRPDARQQNIRKLKEREAECRLAHGVSSRTLQRTWRGYIAEDRFWY
jgi:hypothetical protein